MKFSATLTVEFDIYDQAAAQERLEYITDDIEHALDENDVLVDVILLNDDENLTVAHYQIGPRTRQ